MERSPDRQPRESVSLSRKAAPSLRERTALESTHGEHHEGGGVTLLICPRSECGELNALDRLDCFMCGAFLFPTFLRRQIEEAGGNRPPVPRFSPLVKGPDDTEKSMVLRYGPTRRALRRS